MNRFLIDECLTSELREGARLRRRLCAPHRQGRLAGLEFSAFAVANDYIIMTVNRRDFLKQHARFDIHPGLVILIPAPRKDTRLEQVGLFEKALDAFAAMNDDLTNKVEVLDDGSVHVRTGDDGEHDLGHIGNPKWTSGAHLVRLAGYFACKAVLPSKGLNFNRPPTTD